MDNKNEDKFTKDPKPDKGNDTKGHNGDNGNHSGQVVKPATSHAITNIWGS